MGRLYGRERFQPGAILGQIALLQALFYAAFSAATFVGCTVVGIPWPVTMVVTDEYYTGAWRPAAAVVAAYAWCSGLCSKEGLGGRGGGCCVCQHTAASPLRQYLRVAAATDGAQHNLARAAVRSTPTDE